MSINILNACSFAVANTPGTGSITVGAASTGPFRTLGAAQNGQSFTCAFFDGNAFEVARGCVYTHATLTLTRGTFEDSSTGAPLTLSAATTCAVVQSAAQFEPLNSLSFTNLGTAEAPIWQLNANILPRTNTLANLQALVSGGGELCSATDVDAIVQLQGASGSGTAKVYTPMYPGVWNNTTYTLSSPPAVGTDVKASLLTISGGVSTGLAEGGDVLIAGSPSVWAAGGFNGAGNATVRGGPNNNSGVQRGNASLLGGPSNSGGPAGNAVVTGGENTFSGGSGGHALVTGGAATVGAGAGGDAVLAGGPKPPSGVGGRAFMKDSAGNIVVQVGSVNNTLAFFTATPIVRPAVTGSRGGNAALASLLTQLAALGLITDSSTA